MKHDAGAGMAFGAVSGNSVGVQMKAYAQAIIGSSSDPLYLSGSMLATAAGAMFGLGSFTAPYTSQGGVMVGIYCELTGMVMRAYGDGACYKSRDQVKAHDDLSNLWGSADWDLFFGHPVVTAAALPDDNSWMTQGITFLVGEERLAAPGGLGSSALIAAEIVLQAASFVPGPAQLVSLVAMPLVQAAQGNYGSAMISIALPLGGKYALPLLAKAGQVAVRGAINSGAARALARSPALQVIGAEGKFLMNKAMEKFGRKASQTAAAELETASVNASARAAAVAKAEADATARAAAGCGAAPTCFVGGTLVLRNSVLKNFSRLIMPRTNGQENICMALK